MSPKTKRINKKTATKVAVNSSSSPFSQFPRIIGPGGVTTPTPASALTIPQVFQEQQQQQALMTHTAEWHAETRHKIIAWPPISSNPHRVDLNKARSTGFDAFLQPKILVEILTLMDK